MNSGMNINTGRVVCSMPNNVEARDAEATHTQGNGGRGLVQSGPEARTLEK